jgi:hypothetical protein
MYINLRVQGQGSRVPPSELREERSRSVVIVYGLWFMVYGLWFMVYGLWFMVYGVWFMVHDS